MVGTSKSYYFKEFKYKTKTYKFKKPLRVAIEEYFTLDLSKKCGEMYIPDIPDGYSQSEPFKKPEESIKEYLNYVWKNYLMKENSELDEDELAYKRKWVSLLQPPKQKKGE